MLILILIATTAALGQAQTMPASKTAAAAPTAIEIVRKSLDRDRFNFGRAKDYTYKERSEVRSLDSSGRVNNREIETSEILVLMGRPYTKLIGKDDKPLSAKEQQREQEKIDKELARRQGATEKDAKDFEKRRREGRKFLDEFTSVFDVKVVGEEQLHGRAVWVIEAVARPEYKARERLAKIMQKVRGRIWIDKVDSNWVKVEAVTTDTISVGLSLLRLGPDTKMLFEQTRVNEEIWLPAHIRISADARVGYIRRLRRDIEIQYSEYRKFQTESRMIATEQ